MPVTQLCSMTYFNTIHILRKNIHTQEYCCTALCTTTSYDCIVYEQRSMIRCAIMSHGHDSDESRNLPPAGVLSKIDTLINLFLIYGTSSRPSVAHGFQDNQTTFISPASSFFSEMKSFKDEKSHGMLLDYEKFSFYAKRSLLQAPVLMVLSPRIYMSFRSLRWIREFNMA